MKNQDIEREYTRVKNSLEVLGYKDPLGIDSVKVVNKLLNDLIKTTEAFKRLQDERDKLRLENKSQGDLILPLRNENLSLTKENNELHNELIKLKDNLDKHSIVNVQNLTRTENEKEEFKLLLAQKDSQIKKQQTEIEELKKKMSDLFDKIYYESTNQNKNIMSKTSSNDMYLKSKLLTRGGVEISEPLEGENEENDNPQIAEIFRKELQNFNMNKEGWADDLRKADNEAEKLRNEIRNLRKQISEQENNIKSLRNEVTSRNNEISNLQLNKFIGDDNKEELKIKYNAENLKEQNEKLKSQIDFLNEENHKLQQIDYFHTHRCREDEINKLDKQISSLTKENNDLKNKINRLNSNHNSIRSNEKKLNDENIEKLSKEIKKVNSDLITKRC